MSTVINGLGSSAKMHRAGKKAAGRALDRDIKALRKDIKAARKAPAKCKVAARALFNVGYAAGISFAEMRGASRKTIVTKKAAGAGVKRALKALQSFDKACLSMAAHKKAAKKGMSGKAKKSGKKGKK